MAPAPKVAELRKRLGLSQEEFARQLAVSTRTVSRWETGEAEPSRLARMQLERLTVQSKGRCR